MDCHTLLSGLCGSGGEGLTLLDEDWNDWHVEPCKQALTAAHLIVCRQGWMRRVCVHVMRHEVLGRDGVFETLGSKGWPTYVYSPSHLAARLK